MCTFVSFALGPRNGQVLAFFDGGQQHGHCGIVLVEEVQYIVEVQVSNEVTAYHQHICRFLMNPIRIICFDRPL